MKLMCTNCGWMSSTYEKVGSPDYQLAYRQASRHRKPDHKEITVIVLPDTKASPHLRDA